MDQIKLSCRHVVLSQINLRLFFHLELEKIRLGYPQNSTKISSSIIIRKSFKWRIRNTVCHSTVSWFKKQYHDGSKMNFDGQNYFLHFIKTLHYHHLSFIVQIFFEQIQNGGVTNRNTFILGISSCNAYAALLFMIDLSFVLFCSLFQERSFLLKTLGVESPSLNPSVNPSQPPPCKRALLQSL